MRLLILWICLCAYLNCAGWVLSLAHQLNAAGYAVTLGLGAVAAWLYWRRSGGRGLVPTKLRWRFRRSFPLGFLVLAGLAFLGGVLYAPSNYDGLAYRVPRVLHWLDAGQWHWIHTVFPRLNQRSCGLEWMSAPILCLTHSTRALFLINIISLLFLPGLVFGLFTRLGVRPKVAWWWMWLVPSGYCYILQAGGIGSDLFGALFALAAMNFALRFRSSKSFGDLVVSVLAAAMMTSAKPSNLPLLLPWSLAMLPSVGLVRRWPARVAFTGAVAALASVLPSALLNIHFCGDWTGLKIEVGQNAAGPLFLICTNVFLLALTNLNPPVFPFVNWWQEFFHRHVPTVLATRWEHAMEGGLRTFNLPLMQMEESAGIGFGLCLMLAASWVAVRIARPRGGVRPASLWMLSLRWTPVISVLVLMAHSGLAALSREIAPYYAILLPAVLARPGHEWLVSRRWWRRAGIVVFALAAIPMVLSPARPLFPALTLCRQVHGLPARITTVYTVYRERPDAFAPARAALPAGLKVLGFLGYDDPETSLWLPYGALRIEHIRPEDTAAELKARGVEYALFHPGLTDVWLHISLADWLKAHNAEVVKTIPLNMRASTGPLDWYLVKLN